ncbi:cache domain-containing protein, partial [Pseudoxanthomonas beigongshangi]
MKSATSRPRFSDLSLRGKFLLMLAVLAIGIVALCTVTARRNHTELLQNERQQLQTRVGAALGVIGHYQALARAGAMDEATAKRQALAAVAALRSPGGSDYLWINDQAPTMLMHPHQTALDGKFLGDQTSADGKRIFVEMVKLARGPAGGGFLDYTWAKPGVDEPVGKISYVALYRPWGWVVGSGEYVDDIAARAWHFARVLILAGALVLLAALLLCWLIARSVLTPMAGAVRAIRAVADGNLDVRVAAASGGEIGQMNLALADMVNQLRERTAQERRIAEENLRIRTALDNAGTSVMIASPEREIIYANRAVIELLASYADDIRRALPRFDPDRLIGSNIDVFHADPQRIADYLRNMRATHRGQIRLGDAWFGQEISRVGDHQGNPLGYVVEWRDRTPEVRVEEEIAGIIGAAIAGDLSRRVDTAGKRGFFLQLAERLNRLLDTNAGSLAQVSALLSALSRGDLTVRMDGEGSAALGGVFARMRDDANATVAQLTDIVSRIQDASTAINTAAGEIASGNA